MPTGCRWTLGATLVGLLASAVPSLAQEGTVTFTTINRKVGFL
jgi:hypothetical protein